MLVSNLIWSERFETGSVTIDHGMQELFSVVNEFADSAACHCRRGRYGSGASIKAAYVHLRQAFRAHFAVEEALMATAAYPLIDHHVAMHQHILTEIHFIMYGDHPAANDPDSMEFLCDLIGKWLVSHCLSADRRFVGYSQQQRAGRKAFAT